jgi:hypothetical protein
LERLSAFRQLSLSFAMLRPALTKLNCGKIGLIEKIDFSLKWAGMVGTGLRRIPPVPASQCHELV